MPILDEGCGIDVDKQKLQVRVGGKSLGKYDNTLTGLEKLRSKLPAGTVVHLEASGGYDRLARRVLGRWGYEVRLHNPLRVRKVAEGLGVTSCKTDPQDAIALATVGPLMNWKPAKSLDHEQLCDISRSIESLKKQKTGNDHRMHAAEMDPSCIRAFETVNREIQKQIRLLEALYLKLIDKSPFKDRYELAQTVTCIGPVTARVLSCELAADLTGFTTKQVARYGSLAPMDDSSGTRTGPKRLSKANRHIKAAMYMPALSALRHYGWAQELYIKLRHQGRTHDAALVPVMHKLLALVAAVLIRGTAFEAERNHEKIA